MVPLSLPRTVLLVRAAATTAGGTSGTTTPASTLMVAPVITILAVMRGVVLLCGGRGFGFGHSPRVGWLFAQGFHGLLWFGKRAFLVALRVAVARKHRLPVLLVGCPVLALFEDNFGPYSFGGRSTTTSIWGGRGAWRRHLFYRSNNPPRRVVTLQWQGVLGTRLSRQIRRRTPPLQWRGTNVGQHPLPADWEEKSRIGVSFTATPTGFLPTMRVDVLGCCCRLRTRRNSGHGSTDLVRLGLHASHPR